MKTDLELQQDVMAELTWDPSVNGALIGVRVKDGVVTLGGHVASFAQKWHAERAAQRVWGVKALAVEMDVALSGDTRRTDADIAEAAENVVQWTTYLPRDAIKVMVENGWITLSGDVDWEYQRQALSGAVRYLLGVTGVSNQVAVNPKVSTEAVKADIEAALKRRSSGEPHTIDVSIDKGEVTLSGTAYSWSDREMAQDAAWGSPGVRKVVDRIAVTY
jgi:osmotically-inducible protein OsmY